MKATRTKQQLYKQRTTKERTNSASPEIMGPEHF